MQKHILRADRTPRAVCSDGPNSKDWRISLLLSRLQRLSVTRTFSEAVSVRRRGWRAQMHVKKNFNIKLGRSVALKVLTWWTQTYIEDDILVFFFFLINEELGPVGIWLGRKWDMLLPAIHFLHCYLHDYKQGLFPFMCMHFTSSSWWVITQTQRGQSRTLGK